MLASNPADLAAQSDVIMCCLTDAKAVEAVIFGPDGVAGVNGPSVLVDFSSMDPDLTRDFGNRLRGANGMGWVDAPVSGGTPAATTGTLTIMAGGTPSAIECAKPVFDVLGSKLTHVGDVGSGQIAKAANQMIVGLNIGAVAEALTLAKRAGADPALVRQAIQGGFADSKILDVHGQRMIDDAFAPGAHCTVQRKDMDQAVELAASLGLELPATALNRDLYDRVIEAGHGQLDHAALIKAIDGDG